MQNAPQQPGMQGGMQQAPNQFYQQPTGQPTMQANMPPMPGYNMTNTQQPYAGNTVNMQPNAMPQQPANPQPMPQQPVNQQPIPQQPVMPGMPQQPVDQQPGVVDGVVLSEKSQADLARLDRLKAMGAITEENYQIMKKKIIESN